MEKIIFFTPCFYEPEDSRSTGGTISNYLLFKELSERYEVSVVTAESSIEFDFPVTLIKIGSTENVYNSSLSSRIKRLMRFFWFKKESRKLSKNDYAFAFFTNGAIISCFNFFKNTNRVIITRAFEDFHLNKNNHGLVKRLYSKFLRFKTLPLYASSTKIITNSHFMERKILSNFDVAPEKVFVLYPPIQCPLNVNFSLNSSFCKKRVGMINPSKEKGEDIFVELANQCKDIDFIYFHKTNQNYLQNNIIYKGWATSAEQIFQSIDLLIVPSQWEEPFGRVAAEGILHGKAVVVSNKGGLPEIVDSNFTVNSDDVDLWRNKIFEIISDQDFAKSSWSISYSMCKHFEPSHHKMALYEILYK